MGIAILGGILTSLQEMQASKPLQPSASGTSTSPYDVLPARLPSRFIACMRRAESAEKVRTALGAFQGSVKVVRNDNVASVQQADVILLGCKPYMLDEVLSEPGMREALRGKLLISILAGVSVDQIEKALSPSGGDADAGKGHCQVVRAMANTASMIREGMTVIGVNSPALPAQTMALVTWIFRRIGDVVHLPASNMDVSTALCGSGPAFFLLMLEAAADGAVAMGLPRAEAQRMAAQAMKGAAGLVLNGEHPAVLKDKVSTPGGCTIGGLMVLEEGRVRGTVSRAVREATVVASQLGKGVQLVNGTRFSGAQLD